MIEVTLGANQYVARVEPNQLGNFLLQQLAEQLANSELAGETEDKTRENIRNAVAALTITPEHSNLFLSNLDGSSVNGECDRTNLGEALLKNDSLRNIIEARILEAVHRPVPLGETSTGETSATFPPVRSFDEIQSLALGNDAFNTLVTALADRLGRGHTQFNGEGGTISLGAGILRDARPDSAESKITKVLNIGTDRADLPENITSLQTDPYREECKHFEKILGTAVYEAAKAKYPVFSIDGNEKFDAYVEKLAKAYASSAFTHIEIVSNGREGNIAGFLSVKDKREEHSLLSSLDALCLEHGITSDQKNDVVNQVARKGFARFDELRKDVTLEEDTKAFLTKAIEKLPVGLAEEILGKGDNAPAFVKGKLLDETDLLGQNFKALCRIHKIAEDDIPRQADKLSALIIADLKAKALLKIPPAQLIKQDPKFQAVINAALEHEFGDSIEDIPGIVKEWIRPAEHSDISFGKDVKAAFDEACTYHGIEEKNIAPYLDAVAKTVQVEVGKSRVEEKKRQEIFEEPPVQLQPKKTVLPQEDLPQNDEPKNIWDTVLGYAKDYWQVGGGALAMLIGFIARGPVGIILGIAGAVLAVTQWFNPLSLLGKGGESEENVIPANSI